MKKFLSTTVFCLILTLALILPAAAAEAPTEEIVLTESIQLESIEEAAELDTEQSREENPFFALYDTLSSHLPELFSALSLAGACIIAFCYKRGLLPLLKDGLGAIGSAALDCGKKAEAFSSESKDICEKVNNYVQSITSYVEKIEQALLVLDEKISSFGDQKAESAILHELMLGQVEMLQEIFLVSSLPQFEKDRICKRVEGMRNELNRLALPEASHAEK